MFERVVSVVSNLFLAVSASFSAIFGIRQSVQPQVSLIPTEQVEIVETTTEDAQLIDTPTATPSSKPKTTSTPSPSPEPKIDLNFEKVVFTPEKLSLGKTGQIEEMQLRGGFLFPLKQGNKIKTVSLFIRNNGHEDAKKVVINIIADGETISNFTIDLIEKQSLKTERRSDIKFPDIIGKHGVEFQVNPAKLFAETRYDNNAKIVEYEYIY